MACMIFGAIVVINLLCLTYAIKHFAGWKSNESGKSTIVLKDTAVFLAHKISFQIITDTVLPSISFITFYVVSFVTVVTVRKLKTAMDWRQKTSSHVIDKRQITLVKMLIAISCVYITCNAPKLSLGIARFVVDDFSTSGKYSNFFFATHRAGHVLLMVNSSVNVFIYYKQSSKFRKEFCGMCKLSFKSDSEKNQTNFNSSLSTVTA
ncbi:hypothetical protein ACOMHN_021862 [Nucella lapillus]